MVLIVALIPTSLLVDDIESLFMCSLFICVFFLERCLFRSFIHFQIGLLGFLLLLVLLSYSIYKSFCSEIIFTGSREVITLADSGEIISQSPDPRSVSGAGLNTYRVFLLSPITNSPFSM
jgi:hypothetical protein